MKKQILAICSMLIFISITVALSYFFYSGVNAQIPVAQGSTANVTIMGHVGYLMVNYYPINFTSNTTGSDIGLQPATNFNPKFQEKPSDQPYVRVKTNDSTNVNWCLYVNGTDLTVTGIPSIQGIPVNNVSFNTTCNGTLSAPQSVKILSNGLQEVCCANTPSRGLSSKSFTDIFFYIDIPAGWLNQTYDGAIWFYANSTSLTLSPAEDNSTWYGMKGTVPGKGNTTATIRQYIEFQFYWDPINFGTLTPGALNVNATSTPTPQGFPLNVTIGRGTNIYVDIYVNGTNLNGTSGAAATGWNNAPSQINASQIMYSNRSMMANDIITGSSYKILNTQRPRSIPGVDSSNCHDPVSSLNDNWCGKWYKAKGWTMNGTTNNDTTNYWNITIPTSGLGGESLPAGSYGGNIIFKIVRTGYLTD
jgi:hypothetical protein